MLKRLVRWLLKIAVIIVVMVVIGVVVDYFEHRIPSDSVLVVELTGPVVERGNTSWFGALSGSQTPLDVVRRALRTAKSDPRIVGLALKVIDPTMEMAQAQEIASLVKDFRASGKWTTAYIETAGESEPGNLDYLVAAAAGNVSLMPMGQLNIMGVQIRELFARGTLDMLGIKPEFAAIGAYKTAGNIFTHKGFTPAQQEEDQSLVDNLYAQLVNRFANDRHLQPAVVQNLIDQAPLSAADALQDHLVDRTEYEDQFDNRVKHRGGGTHALIDYQNYASPRFLGGFGGGPRIAVVYGEGAIVRGESGYDPVLSPEGRSMGSGPMVRAFRRVRKDDSIKAVVFRIDSPGGSVIASELIRRQVQLTAAVKPVIVSMSGYAASGGYWIATPGRAIFADPGTITGSIGVLGGKFDISQGAAKIGVNTAAVSRGRNVGMFDPFTSFTPEQAAFFHDRMLGDVYRDFVARVAASRHLTVAQVNKIAQGRVWTGQQALGIKLIDHLGGFDAALAYAKAQAGIAPTTSVEIVNLPRRPGILSQLLGLLTGADELAQSRDALHLAAPVLRLVEEQRALAGAAGLLYSPNLPAVR